MELLGSKHKSVRRDYRSRVCDTALPKHIAATMAKKWDKEYWDGDRRTGYGGYYFLPGYWSEVAVNLASHYGLTRDSRVLDVGCGKGFLLAELKALVPGIQVRGLDVSHYAISHAPEDVASELTVGDCEELPFEGNEFDLVLSINVLHNLIAPKLLAALQEMSRVAPNSYLVVESYASEEQKQNLLYWQLTCEAFNRPEEWEWWFALAGYKGDWEFIFFD